MKFGGTSLANAERIKNISDIIKSRIDKNPIVVVSAVSGITDKLVKLAKDSSTGKSFDTNFNEIINIHKDIINSLSITQNILDEDFEKLNNSIKGVYLLREISPRSLDLISSFGEVFSSKIIVEHLKSIQIVSKQYHGGDTGIVTDSNFTNAEILEETYEKINKNLNNLNHVPIITGFIAKDREGETTTLGRGGSDYTASIIGAALNAKEIEIWTDVDGIKTADPKIVNNAKQWDKITFNEASEMAYFGAKVLHPKTIKPAINKLIPVRILNTRNIENAGTLIVKEDKEECIFRTISSKNEIIIIRVCSTEMLLAYGFLEKIFHILSKHKISIDLVSTSEVTVSMTLDNINNSSKNLELAISELKEFGKIEVLKERSLICVVGKDIKDKPEVLGRIFEVCKNSKINIELISQGVSPLSISFVVKQEDSPIIIKELHKELFEKND
ncbi:MAG: aspartate kinase [Nanoarchaeota archaeon]|nr:aspartate kinase [Nanoarchaeota archaeon]